MSRLLHRDRRAIRRGENNGKALITGNEALAESCLRAGCRFFSGYPITPQSAILEYLSWRMDELGGNCVQTESELAGINMLLGAASAGARALTDHFPVRASL